jgi:hypothetical protein
LANNNVDRVEGKPDSVSHGARDTGEDGVGEYSDGLDKVVDGSDDLEDLLSDEPQGFCIFSFVNTNDFAPLIYESNQKSFSLPVLSLLMSRLAVSSTACVMFCTLATRPGMAASSAWVRGTMTWATSRLTTLVTLVISLAMFRREAAMAGITDPLMVLATKFSREKS